MGDGVKLSELAVDLGVSSIKALSEGESCDLFPFPVERLSAFPSSELKSVTEVTSTDSWYQ